MSWFDDIGAGLGSAFGMLTGTPGGAESGQAAAGYLASSPVGQGAQGAYNNLEFGKSTGLAPYMQMLGIGPEKKAPAPAEDRMAYPAELEDLKNGLAPPTAGGDRSFSTGVTGTQESKWGKTTTDLRTGQTTEGPWSLPSYQNWDAVGTSGGNRQSDIDARNGVKPVTAGAPTVYQPDLSGLAVETDGQRSDKTGAGEFHDVRSGMTGTGVFGDWAGVEGSKSGWGGKTKIDPTTGKGSTSIYSTSLTAGYEQKDGWRAVDFNDDKTLSASAEAGTVTSFGANVSAGLDTKNGLNASVGVGGRMGAYAQADANAKTEAMKIGGVDYDAGIGVHGDTFVGAKLGASGQIGLGPDFIGAKGSAGAFLGAEAAGDIHGNLGPLGAKLGASGMVGAGAGAEGDVSYKDGQFHIGGKLFACLGYGGSISGDITIDFGKIAKSLGPVGEGMLDLAEGGIGGAAQIAGGVLGGAYDLGAGVVNGLGDVGAGAISGIGALMGGIGEGVGDAAGGVASGVGEAVGGVLSGVGDVAGGIGDGFSNFAEGDVLSGLGDIGGGIVNGVGDVAGGLGRGALDVLGGVGSGALAIGGGIVSGVGDVLGGVGSGLLDVGGGLVSGLGSVGGGLVDGIGTMAGGIGSAIGDIASW